MKIGSVELLNIDCMEYMKTVPDKHFDLAIVDPPYGIDATKMKLGEGGGLYRKAKTYKRGDWDSQPPKKEYFEELFRISKNQIIWGANHFISLMPKDSPCWLFWDKNNGETSFADGELAWTSFKQPVRKFKFTWSGFIQGKMGDQKEVRIHPTQKPAALYGWILNEFSEPESKIFDSHLGSAGIAIACHDYKFELTGCGIDKDYFDAAVKRLKNHVAQTTLF